MGIKNYKVYTPFKYADIIIKSALKNYFNREYTKEKLDKIRAADLSCGTGNLLLVMLDKLIRISKKITGEYYFNPDWIRGYDIDKNAFDEYVRNAYEILKKYNLQGEIHGFIMDSLMVKSHVKYNIVIGNPPYLGEKNHQKLFRNLKETEFGKKYYEAKMDYFYYFIEKGIDVLEDNGILVYITTNYWLKADSAVILRNKLKTEGYFTDIIDYNVSIFKNAPGQHNMIFSWKKSKNNLKDFTIKIEKEENKFTLSNKNIYDSRGNIIIVDEKNRIFNEKILSKSNYKLEDIFNINQGIVTGCDKAFITKEYDERFKEYLKPFYKNKDVFKYNYLKENYFWIFYMDRDQSISEELKNFFLPYKETLLKRREVQNNQIEWWQLSWAREKSIMTDEKILVRQRCKTNFFAYSNEEFYGSADIYYLTLKDKSFNIFYILGYLNCDTFYQWYKNNGKHKGYNLEFYTTPLKQVPFYYPSSSQEVLFIENLVKQQIKCFSEERQEEINRYFRGVYGII